LEFIIGIIVVYASVLILLFIFQRNLMYHPLENNYSGDIMEVEVDKVKIITADNINLLGWFHKKDLKKFKTIVYFHGNAGKLENRIHKLNHFKDMDINFLIIAWRGFSGNKGKPNEKGLYIDARSTIQWLKKIRLKRKRYYTLWRVSWNWCCN
jgi:predicted alpha/beta-fold hydrolase